MPDATTILERPPHRAAVDLLVERLRSAAETPEALAGLYAADPGLMLCWAADALASSGDAGSMSAEVVMDAAVFERIREITGRDR